MDLSDLEKLLEPISEEEPCGPDLEYDADFGEMERAAESKPEQQFGDTIVAAEPPDWKDVQKKALALLERTKDMRVVACFARASLHQDGLVGFRLAMELMRGYVENFWDSVHPGLDEDDDNDPTYRTNTLITLCDEETILRELREAPLVSSRAMGRFSLKDIEQAIEAVESPPEKAEESGGGAWADDSETTSEPEPTGPTPAAIDAAFTDASLEEVQAVEEATRIASECLGAIDQFVTEQVGAARAVSLRPTQNLLDEMNKAVVAQLERLGVYEEEPEEEEVVEVQVGEDGEPVEGASSATPTAAFKLNGKIGTRKDAIKALDAVCEYYENNEPSSPLPLLIRRAQRLASKSFLEILQDLAPDAVAQAEALGGGGGGDGYSGSGDSQAESTESEESSGW